VARRAFTNTSYMRTSELHDDTSRRLCSGANCGEIASTGITYHNYMSRDYSGDDSIAFRRRTNRLLLLLIPSLSVTRLIDSGLFHPCILPSSRSLSLSRNLSRFSSCSCGAVRKRANGTRPVSACPLSHSNMKSHLNGRNSILWRICQL